MKYVLLVIVSALFVTSGLAGSGGTGCTSGGIKRSIEESRKDSGTLTCYKCSDCNAKADYLLCAGRCPTGTTECYKEILGNGVNRGCSMTTNHTDTCQEEKPGCLYYCKNDKCNGGENLTNFPYVMVVLATLHIVLMKMLN